MKKKPVEDKPVPRFPPKEYAAFVDSNSHTCIRIEVGTQYTRFIPMHAEGLAIQRLENAEFGRTYKQLEGYGLGTAVFHYLRAAERFGASDRAWEILSSLQQFITETELEALVAKVKKETPSMTSADIKAMIMKGLPKEKAEQMHKVGKGAMEVVAKHNPDSASAKYLAAEKKGPKALAKHLKEDAKTAAQSNSTQEQDTMATKTKKSGKKSTKPVAAKKPAAAAKKPAANGNGAAKKPAKVSAAQRYAGKTIKVLTKEHGAREGTKRAKGMEILISSKTTDEALKKFEKHEGIDSSFIRYAVENKIIALK